MYLLYLLQELCRFLLPNHPLCSALCTTNAMATGCVATVGCTGVLVNGADTGTLNGGNCSRIRTEVLIVITLVYHCTVNVMVGL